MSHLPAARAGLISLAALLLATLIVDTGQGLVTSLVPLRLEAMGFAARDAGLVGATYFAGFVAGLWYGALVVQRVGHIRAFAGFLALLAALALALPLIPELRAWMVLRFLHGGSIAAVAMVIESWLTAAVPPVWRGRVLALFTMLTYAGFSAGQLLLRTYDVAGYELFSIAAILLALSSVPVAFSRRLRAPPITEPHGMSPAALLRISPLALAGSLVSGMVLGAFLTLGPLFATRIGFSAADAGLIMAFGMFGGVALEWPLGQLSDRFDRRTVMLLATASGAGLAIVIALAGDLDLWLLLVLVALFGGVAFAFYPLALAHATDHLGEGEDMVPVATGLLLTYGLGAVVGPPLASLVFDLAAGRGLFVYMAAVLALFGLYGLWRTLRRPAPEAERQRAYVVFPETESTATLFGLDPRLRRKEPELEAEPRPEADRR